MRTVTLFVIFIFPVVVRVLLNEQYWNVCVWAVSLDLELNVIRIYETIILPVLYEC
jgi:hypothetical protein